MKYVSQGHAREKLFRAIVHHMSNVAAWGQRSGDRAIPVRRTHLREGNCHFSFISVGATLLLFILYCIATFAIHSEIKHEITFHMIVCSHLTVCHLFISRQFHMHFSRGVIIHMSTPGKILYFTHIRLHVSVITCHVFVHLSFYSGQWGDAFADCRLWIRRILQAKDYSLRSFPRLLH